MKKKQEELISVPKLCELYGKDSSQMRKMINKLNIPKKVVKRASDNKNVSVITQSDHQKLVDHFENLTAKNASKDYISVAEACKKLGYKSDQMSNFTRACTRMGFSLKEKKFNGRTQKCITKNEFKKFMQVRNAITIVDID